MQQCEHTAVEGAVATFRGEAVGINEHPTQTVELGNLDYLSLSAISKVFAGSITYPYQVLRARLQTYDAPLKYKGVTDVMMQVWRKEGIAGFYKG